MPATEVTNNVAAMVREFMPFQDECFRKNTVLFKELGITDFRTIGRSVDVPFRATPDGNFKITDGTLTIPTAVLGTSAEASYTGAEFTAVTTAPLELYIRGRKDDDAHIDLIAKKIEEVYTFIDKNISKRLFSVNGELDTFTYYSATQFYVDWPNLFRVGQIVDAWDSLAAGATQDLDSGTVSAVDLVNGLITTGAHSLTAANNGEYLYTEDERAASTFKCFTGLYGLADDGTLMASAGGLTRTSYPQQLLGHVDSGNSSYRPWSEELHESMMQKIRRANGGGFETGGPDIEIRLIGDDELEKVMRAYFRSERTRMGISMEGGGDEINLKYGGVNCKPVFHDFAHNGRALYWNPDETFVIWNEPKLAGDITGEGGLPISTTVNTVELRFVGYVGMGRAGNFKSLGRIDYIDTPSKARSKWV